MTRLTGLVKLFLAGLLFKQAGLGQTFISFVPNLFFTRNLMLFHFIKEDQL